MGKHLWIEHTDDQLDGNHPGCMWGILHALDYHHLHYNVKKMLPHRKHDGRRHGKGNRSPTARLGLCDSGEVQKLLEAEASHLLVNQNSTETISANKRSLKARIKALVAKEISKEEDNGQRGSGFPGHSRLQRTFSIHHLEPSELGLKKISSGWRHPNIFIHNKADNRATRLKDPAQMKGTDKPVAFNQKIDGCGTENVMDYLEHDQPSENHTLSKEKCNKEREISVDQKIMPAHQLRQNASQYQLEYGDVLELLKVNKELFKKKQNSDVGIATFRSLQASNPKARLTKSGSFPVADLSRSRKLRPGKLIHKQNKVWSFPKEEKLQADTEAPKMVASMFSKDLCTNSGNLMAEGSGGSVLNQETSFSSLGSRQELDKQESSKAVLSWKYDNQRIEFAVNEDKIESDYTSQDGFLDEAPTGYSPSSGRKEMAGRCKQNMASVDGLDNFSGCQETDGPVYDLSKGTHIHIGRSSSLKESMDRYTRLFDYSCSSEGNLPLSKSLKLTNERENPSGGRVLISFRRIRSLSHLDSYTFFQNEESHDAFLSNTQIVDSRTNTESSMQSEPKPVDLLTSAEKYVQLDDNDEAVHLDSTIERGDSSPRMECLASSTVGIDGEGAAKMDGLGEEMDEPAVGKSNSSKELEITFIDTDSIKVSQPSPVSDLDSCFQEVTDITELPTSEGLECSGDYSDVKESSVNSLNSSNTDCLPQYSSTMYSQKSAKNHRRTELHRKGDADLNYVREVLKRSGFNENGFHGTWYSSEQPLNPSVFEEMEEVWWPHESEWSEEDIISECCHHQLLFDLVNETLLQIHEGSFTYYPSALSSNCRVHPVPLGYPILKGVLESISSLGLKPELDHSLDCFMAQDLAKHDAWMNLQTDSECVALELEDLIFDELIGEVMCALDL